MGANSVDVLHFTSTFCVLAGIAIPCESALISAFAYFMRAFLPIGSRSNSIISIVVVECTCGIHITHIIAIVGVRSTEPDLQLLTLYIYFSSDFRQFLKSVCKSLTSLVQYSIRALSMPNARYAISIILSKA